MNIFVINLEHQTQRKESMSSQLNSLGLPFEIVSATNGRLLSQEESDAICDQIKAKKQIKRHLSAGEIGCAASHLNILRKIVSDSIPLALILEDDIKIGKDTLEILKTLENSPQTQNPYVFLLNHAKKYSAWSQFRVTPDGKYSFFPLVDGYGACSYVVTNAAAKRLLEHFSPLYHPIDYWNLLQKRKVVRVFALVPYCIENSVHAQESSIDVDRRVISSKVRLSPAELMQAFLEKYLYRKFIYQVLKPFLRIKQQSRATGSSEPPKRVTEL